jgi:hypothetical protein
MTTGPTSYAHPVFDAPPPDARADACPASPLSWTRPCAAGSSRSGSTATGTEGEEFESGSLADETEWLLRHPDHPDAAAVRERSDDHRTRWLRGYRHGLGFAYLTLGRPA